MKYDQDEEFSTNPLDDYVTGRVIVYFHGLQNDTVDTKSTRCDVIIERIPAKFHSLNMIPKHLKTVTPPRRLTLFTSFLLPS